MSKFETFVGGLIFGGVAMYLLDPDRGNRRRAVIRDRAIHFAHEKQEALQVMSQDLANRSKGVVHNLEAAVMADSADDRVIAERVRSAIGRHCSHPHAVMIEVKDCDVVLRGDVLAEEVESLFRSVRHVRGVGHVENQLKAHPSPENIPSLQGQRRVNRRPDRWTPGAGMMMSTLGAGLMLGGLARRGAVGGVMSSVGLGLVAKAFADTEARFEPLPNHGKFVNAKSRPAIELGEAMRAQIDVK